MEKTLSIFRPRIESFISSYLDVKGAEFSKVNRWGPDVVSRLKKYVLNGKMLRGCLVIMSAKMFSGEDFDEDSAIRAAAAIELAHSSLLVHDDIIDRDNIRRGSPSMHYQYETYAHDNKLPDQKQFGISLGICVGDIGFFMANELLSELNIDYYKKLKLIKHFNIELCNVGFAEMQDVNFEYLSDMVSMDDILNMYKYKTAHYTFSLPMVMGAIIAGSKDETLQKLRMIGEELGTIFQIKDDELGIFGDEKTIGKSVGIDIRDGKKTIYYALLLAGCNKRELAAAGKIFGNKDIGTKEIQKAQKMLVEKGVTEAVQKKMKSMEDNSRKLISGLEVDNDAKNGLLSILRFNLERNK